MTTPPPFFSSLDSVLDKSILTQEVEDDCEGEDEATPIDQVDEEEGEGEAAAPNSPAETIGVNVSPAPWSRDSLAEASRGVKDTTFNKYNSLSTNFADWLVKKGFVGKNCHVFEDETNEDIAAWICLWIMEQADDFNLDGSRKPSTQSRVSYGHATAMRSSLTYRFAVVPTRGKVHWHRNDAGVWKGNPSLSFQVSHYMLSLRRRKAQSGESSMSSRAISSRVLRELHEHNHTPEMWELKSYAPVPRSRGFDLGPHARRLLQAVYMLAFWCLLRSDEVLTIQMKDVKLLDANKGVIELTLTHRKTHQFEHTRPFTLHPRPIWDAYLCPVRALAEWLKVYKQVDPHAYLFPDMASGDRPGTGDRYLDTRKFLRMMRHNLEEIERDATPYGTHSFRRGGCQFLATEMRWPITRICEWGGWSMNFSHMTIVKYLISWNDEPLEPREHYLDPNCPPTIRCYACGRSCHCA